MPINNLKEIYTNKGKDILSKLLDSKKITVYEQLDGLNFGFRYVENNIIFFKRNPNSSIGDVDRTLTSMYEKPIAYINSLEKTPEMIGKSFGCLYFPSKHSSILYYDTQPKNNLILSYVEDEQGVKILDKGSLDKYADMLDIGRSPIIFEGSLTTEQKTKIFDFLQMTSVENDNVYDGMSFGEYLYSVLCPEQKETILNSNLKGHIESLIFRFETEEGDATYSKIVNPYFEQIIDANKKKYINNTDNMYHLVLSDIMDFLMFVKIEDIALSKSNFEERYIELICKLFNKLIKQKGSDYEDIVIELPEHLSKEFNNVNYEKIPNDQTKEYILPSFNNREIFRIFLASFRKRRVKYSTIFNKSMNKMFNDLVNRILNRCVLDINVDDIQREFTDDIVSESFITFDEFTRVYMKGEDSTEVVGLDLDSYLRKIPDNIIDFRETDFDIKNFTSSMLVKTTQKQNIRDKRKVVNLLVDTFDPMTELVYDFAKYSYQRTGNPVILVAVNPRQDFYSTELLEKIFKGFIQEDWCENYIILDTPNIKKIIYNFEIEYKVEKILSNERYMKFIEMQLISNYRDNNYMGLYPDIADVSEYYHADKSIVTRSNDALKNYDFSAFKKNVPEAYSVMFNDIYKNYKYHSEK